MGRVDAHALGRVCYNNRLAYSWLGTETCHNQVSIALVDTISLKCSLVWTQVYIICRCSCNWMVNTLHDMIFCVIFTKNDFLCDEINWIDVASSVPAFVMYIVDKACEFVM